MELELVLANIVDLVGHTVERAVAIGIEGELREIDCERVDFDIPNETLEVTGAVDDMPREWLESGRPIGYNRWPPHSLS